MVKQESATSNTAPEDSTVTVDESTGEIVTTKRQFSDDELRNIDSLDAIKALLGERVANAADLGSGFAVLRDEQKRRLVGVPLLFLMWAFSKSDLNDAGEKVSAHVVQLDNTSKVVGKFIINAGSFGIYEQLKEFTERTGESKGLFAPNGLRVSDYKFTDDEGREKPASTYYIDTTPAV
jgi:hypothetical protein